MEVAATKAKKEQGLSTVCKVKETGGESTEIIPGEQQTN